MTGPLSLYGAISDAETGSFENPWIRTTASNTPGGSSAYGPVQITGTKAKDYATRNLLSKESQAFVNDVYGPMTDQFLKYGNEPDVEGYDPMYDYGGSGNLTEDQQRQYLKLADEMLAYDYMRSQGDTDAFIKSWRGTGDDERYNKAVKAKLEQLISR